MGSYSESEKASQHREMPTNAVAVLLRSGRDQASSWTRWTFRRETQHLGPNLRFKGSPLCDRPRRISCDANAVLDRLLQSMGVRFSGSVQRSSLNKFHVCG